MFTPAEYWKNRTEPSARAKFPPPVWNDHMWYTSHLLGGFRGAWKYTGKGHAAPASSVPIPEGIVSGGAMYRAQIRLSRFGEPRRPQPHCRSAVGGRSPNASVLLNPSVTEEKLIFIGV